MAASKFNLLKILTFITSVSAKIPKALEFLNALYNLFAEEIEAAIPGDELQQVQLTTDEMVLVEQITAAVSGEGSQAAFDLTRLHKLVKFANEARNTPGGKMLIAILTGMLGG